MTKLPLEELIGSLITHEIITMKRHQKVEGKKKKIITLKALAIGEKVEKENKSEDKEG